ncbi:MAG: Uma2 family endonuclease, partial [Pseudomonadota bacterium]
MTELKQKSATYADLERVPSHLVAEILDGVLITSRRPRMRHSFAQAALTVELSGPFQRSRGGPGGWKFYPEPELHIG